MISVTFNDVVFSFPCRVTNMKVDACEKLFDKVIVDRLSEHNIIGAGNRSTGQTDVPYVRRKSPPRPRKITDATGRCDHTSLEYLRISGINLLQYSALSREPMFTGSEIRPSKVQLAHSLTHTFPPARRESALNDDSHGEHIYEMDTHSSCPRVFLQ